jgi:hypothetical protein
VFSRFRWPLPTGGEPGAWIEADAVAACRSGVHGCRVAHLPYWLAPVLYEAELGGEIVEEPLKVVAARGRLVRRVEAWDDAARAAFAASCAERARELAADALPDWPPRAGPEPPPAALAAFMAARIAERLAGPEAYRAERGRQSAWLADRLGLEG